MRGVSPSQVELYGQHLHGPDREVKCFVDLGWRYITYLPRYLADGQSWLEIPHPHRTKPVEALFIQLRAATSAASR